MQLLPGFADHEGVQVSADKLDVTGINGGSVPFRKVAEKPSEFSDHQSCVAVVGHGVVHLPNGKLTFDEVAVEEIALDKARGR